MGLMTILMLCLYTIVCVFLIFVILIQAGDKGGGLSSLGSSSQGLSDALGATGAEKTMNNVTTIAAILFIVLAIALSVTLGRTGGDNPMNLPSKTAPPATPLSGMNPSAPGTVVPGAATTPANANPAPSQPVTGAPAVPGQSLPEMPVPINPPGGAAK